MSRDTRVLAGTSLEHVVPGPSRYLMLQIEEFEVPFVGLEDARFLQVEHAGKKSVRGMEQQRMERPLRTRSFSCGILGEWQLEVCVQLDAFAAEASVLQDRAAGRDVPSAGEWR